MSEPWKDSADDEPGDAQYERVARCLEHHENGPLRASAIAYDRALNDGVLRPAPEPERRIHLLSDQ